MIKVVIPEPIPSLNKGEIAILEGIREAHKIVGDVSLSVYSPKPWLKDDKRNYEDRYKIVTGVDLFDLANKFLESPEPRGRMHFLNTWGKLLAFSLSCRILGKKALNLFNDDLFSEMYNSDIIQAGHDGMLGYDHFFLALAACIMKKPLAFYGGGNDGMGRKSLKTRLFFRFMANYAITFFVRDENTEKYFVDNDADPNKVKLFPDPAVLVKPAPEQRIKEILKAESIPDDNTPLYGLIPVTGGIVFDESFSHEPDLKKKHKLRVDFWVEIMKRLLEKTNAHFIFLPHCIGPVAKNDDRIMSRDIYNAMTFGKERMSLLEKEYSIHDLKGLQKRFDFVLGERTHGLIGAFSVATPLFALAVEEDIRMHYIINRMFKQGVYNLNNPDIEELSKILINEWDNRKATKEKLLKLSQEIHAEAYRAAGLLKEAVHKALNKN
jgi:polysaccharide pyruvyl transferase WcaK-like protein